MSVPTIDTSSSTRRSASRNSDCSFKHEARLVDGAEPQLEMADAGLGEGPLARTHAVEAGPQIVQVLPRPLDLGGGRVRAAIDQAVDGRGRRALAGHHQRRLAGEGAIDARRRASGPVHRLEAELGDGVARKGGLARPGVAEEAKDLLIAAACTYQSLSAAIARACSGEGMKVTAARQFLELVQVVLAQLALHALLEPADAGLDDPIDLGGASVVERLHQAHCRQDLGEGPPRVLDRPRLHLGLVRSFRYSLWRARSRSRGRPSSRSGSRGSCPSAAGGRSRSRAPRARRGRKAPGRARSGCGWRASPGNSPVCASHFLPAMLVNSCLAGRVDRRLSR